MKKILVTLILAAFLAAPISNALAEKGDLARLSPSNADLNIMLGKAELVQLGANVSDVMVANASIIDVMPVKANELYVVGNALGDTNIMIMDTEGNILRRMNIHVQMDTEKLEALIVKLYPNENVEIQALTDQLVLTGHVSTPAVSNSIANLVAQYAAEIQGTTAGSIDEVVTNMLTVAGEQQVMLKVKIVEASRTALKDLGIETEGTGNLGVVGTALTAASALGLTAPAQLGVLALNYDSGSFGPLSFLARALEDEGIVNTLAEPNLTAISGEQAGFLAGGEVPIPTGLDQNGNLVYEFRPFGVSLNFRPTVMSANRISMEMSTEVSSANYDEALELTGVTVPTFNVRRADTTVELPSGGTLMIAGLLQSDTTSSLSSIPGVGKVPVVGDLLKSDSFQRNETELVVIVTPYLVKPFAENKADAASEPKPVDISNGGTDDNLGEVPRLSLEDLESMPETNDMAYAHKAPTKLAPAAGLSQEAILRDEIDLVMDEPIRDKSKLNGALKENFKKTFGAKNLDAVMKDSGGFGYMMD